MRECVGETKPARGVKAKVGHWGRRDGARGLFQQALAASAGPDEVYANGSEFERIWSDPKDRDLCVRRLKSGESLMEGRRDVDVQIALVTCAKGRKTNRTV